MLLCGPTFSFILQCEKSLLEGNLLSESNFHKAAEDAVGLIFNVVNTYQLTCRFLCPKTTLPGITANRVFQKFDYYTVWVIQKRDQTWSAPI